jgi:hypothetical protein
MAVAIRFNTVIVAKGTIEANYPGGVDRFRADQWPFQLDYCEDAGLVAVISMGGHDRYLEELAIAGLVVEGPGASRDVAYADQACGPEPGCRWLDAGKCHGLPVCWLRGGPPGYVVDYPGRSFIRRAKWAPCAACGAPLGVAPATAAVDARERGRGPLGFIDFDRDRRRETRYVVACRACGAETTLDWSGQRLGWSGSAAEPDAAPDRGGGK